VKTNKAADAVLRYQWQANPLHNSDTTLQTNQVVPLAKDGVGMINQVCEEKDAALTTGQSVPAPKDGEELVNSEEGTTKDATTNPPEPLAEQKDIVQVVEGLFFERETTRG